MALPTNLRVIRTIAVHEYATNVRRPGFIVFTLIIPALGALGLLIAAFFSGQAAQFLVEQFGQPASRPVGVVDGSGLVTPLPAGYAGRFELLPDEAAGRRALAAGTIRGFVVIPADYVATGRVRSYAPGGFSGALAVDADDLRPLLVAGLLGDRLDPATRARAVNPVQLVPVALDGAEPAGGVASLIASFLIPYLLAILLVISIFVSSSYLLRSVSEEKESRVIEIVLSSVSASELLAGKVIGLGALGLTQIAVWALSSLALSGGVGALLAGAAVALKPSVFVLGLVYFLLGYVVYGTLMAAAGSLGTNLRESQQLAGIFSFVAAIPWMLNGLLFANPNAPIARVLSFFPLTAPTMMMLRLPLGEVPPVDIAGSIVVLLLSVPLCVWGGARVFRLGLLLYGKRPTPAEIWRTLRAT